MNKNFKCLGIACACLLLVTGCGKVAQLENGQDALVYFSETDSISVDTLYQELKESYGLEALLTLIDKQVYEAEYPNELENAVEYASSYLDSMISYYGSEDDLLSQLNGSFTSLEAYEKYLYVAYLQNLAIDAYSKSLITEKQIQKYYDEEYYEDVTLSHILITSNSLSTDEEEDVEAAAEEAKATAKSIIDQLKDADSDDVEELFAELATEYSDDDATNTSGGSLGRINYEDLDAAYDELVDAAIELKDGNFSTSIIETELGIHVVYKHETHEKTAIEDVTEQLTEVLSLNAIAADSMIVYNGLVFYREKYGFNIEDDEMKKSYIDYMNDLEDSIKESANTAY